MIPRRGFSALPSARRLYSSNAIIKEHDILYIRQQGPRYPKWHLTPPLRRDARVKLAYGASVPASELIGRRYLDSLRDEQGHRLVLHEPSLASYILLSDRNSTPIYPHDATTIVSLLDLNLPRPGEDDPDEPPFEVFEAGTGMGSLTLHIARALRAANPPVPPSLRSALLAAPYKTVDDPSPMRLALEPEDASALETYRGSRAAVLHSLDRAAWQSRQAYGLIRNFKRALYLPGVDFHVTSIDSFVSERLSQNGGSPFLSRAVLDLPSAEDHASPVITALHPNALLVIFVPSVNQVADFTEWAAEAHPGKLRLEKVLELPTIAISDGKHEVGGGRPWDVRTVVPRAWDVGAKTVKIMRPKVGDRLAGGGFVAVLRRWPDPVADEVAAVEAAEEACVDEGEVTVDLRGVDVESGSEKEKSGL